MDRSGGVRGLAAQFGEKIGGGAPKPSTTPKPAWKPRTTVNKPAVPTVNAAPSSEYVIILVQNNVYIKSAYISKSLYNVLCIPNFSISWLNYVTN